ncbi:O-antigen ligase family protein [Photobacterium japonica]
MLKSNASRIMLVSILTAGFPLLCLAYGKGYNLAASLLLLTSLFFIPQWKKIKITSEVKLIIATFSLYFGSYVLSTLLHHDELSKIDQPSRIVLALFVFALLLRYPPKINWLFNGILLGSALAGLTAIYHVFGLDLARAFTGLDTWYLSGYMPIQSGNMAMTLAIMSLAIAVYHLKSKQWIPFSWAIIASGLGVLASLLSASRGGWIFLPLTLIYLLMANRHYLNRRLLTAIVPVFLLSSAVVAQIPTVNARVQSAVKEIAQYNQGNEHSSLGIRFELWKSALYTFQEYPLLGAGYGERLELRKHWGDMGLIDKAISRYPIHSHNQYLEDLSVRGITGITALILLFAVPFSIFHRNLAQAKDALAAAVNQCGAVSIILMVGYQLSQAMFRHNSGIIFFSIITVIFLASSLMLKQGKAS